MKNVRLLCLDVEDKGLYEVKCSELDDYYKALKCDCFDITNRKIGKKRFDIFCDDIGLFRDKPIVSAIDAGNLEPALVGNLIFANHDNEGNTMSLSDDDIEMIKKELITVIDYDNMKMWKVVQISY